MKLFFIFLEVFICYRCVSSSLDDVTNSIGLRNVKGLLAAFGDFNADKQTDLFLIKEQCVEVLLWNKKDQKFERRLTVTCTEKSGNITNVVPADFDGDGHLDTLIATQSDSADGKVTKIEIAWGMESKRSQIKEYLLDQPIVLDVNGDLLPDLFGTEFSTKQRSYWINQGNRTFVRQPQKQLAHPLAHNGTAANLSSLRIPHSNAFVDLTGDYTADLFVTSETAQKEQNFELWENKNGQLVQTSLPYNFTVVQSIKYLGQSVFADVDLDGELDHVLPACFDNSCNIYVFSQEKWTILAATSAHNNLMFFDKTPNSGVPGVADIILRAGDYNLDGYPDFLAVVYTRSPEGDAVSEVVLLVNSPCSANREVHCNFPRTLEVSVTLPVVKPILATFLDLYENGVVDILVVSQPSTGHFTTTAYRNNLLTDSCFLKVLVLQGRCFDSCSGDVIPYGVNHAGPLISYTTTDSEGLARRSAAAQLSQSSYFALQMPYVVFGLGRTPNFVDRLTVGIPRARNKPIRSHYWTSIIPNSQVIIIPYPPDNPSRWKSKLLVTPSKLVLMTAGAMLATCLFIGGIIGILHWKEKRADQLEKRQDAHKFHFDAM